MERTEGDTLNGFPPKKLTLDPQGCGYYKFPVKPDEINVFIQPAKKVKEGSLYWVKFL